MTGIPVEKRLFLFAFLFFCFLSSSVAQAIDSLWLAYRSNKYNHSNIPNNSYAGYGTGIVSIPNPSWTVYNVTSAPYNAVANDNNDDQPAIQAAIEAAHAAGKGIVYLPAGTFRLHKPIYIKYDSIIVRGAGSTGGSATILDFRYSMYTMFTTDIDAGFVGPGGLWWASGLVWIGPGDSFNANGSPNMFEDYEHWRTTSTLATVTAISNPGTFSITVDNTATLATGQRVMLRYTMPSDRSLIKHIHGHAATESQIDTDAVVGDCTNIKAPGESYYYWPAVIQSISGNVVTFDRPLRIKVDPTLWPATLRSITSMVSESGIEDVQIKGHNATGTSHLATPTTSGSNGGSSLGGWNGVYINRSWNCWVDNVRFTDLECGVIFSAAKNCSALNTYITASSSSHSYHHPFAYRVYSSDNLVENFTIDGPGHVRHGINAEWYSSGNVYSKGTIKVGTFDSHRASAFDLIRTEITVANDDGSAPGGAGNSGPFAGKRFVHWNITQSIPAGYTYTHANGGGSRDGNDVYEPLQFPMGAFVAITGTRDNSNGEYVPVPSGGGTLGSIVITDAIATSSVPNLYTAQLNLRMGMGLPVSIANFDVKKINDTKAQINWTVADPQAGDQFVVQWSKDGIQFTDIEKQAADVQETNYQFQHLVIDKNANQYYRLKIITAQGKIIYSVIKIIKAAGQNSNVFLIYPNPANNKLNIDFSNTAAQSLKRVRILNSMGQIIKTYTTINLLTHRNMVIDIHDLPAGQYYLESLFADGAYRQAFAKQ